MHEQGEEPVGIGRRGGGLLRPSGANLAQHHLEPGGGETLAEGRRHRREQHHPAAGGSG
ncbi:MAG: hypothetical protein BWX64_01551 [Acidobacteria bacterium ADurb.Bin051]|nr:MAG: hypothetical protein BWX64_01551 [Acidobacteria bacterium ADurb.Bin051]